MVISNPLLVRNVRTIDLFQTPKQSGSTFTATAFPSISTTVFSAPSITDINLTHSEERFSQLQVVQLAGIIEESGPHHLRVQGSPQHNHISGIASGFPELSLAGLRVVCFVWCNQGHRAVEEDVVVRGLTSMLEISWSIF
jgi:hypothetical protein